MNQKIRTIGNAVVRLAAGWLASLLAVAVSVLGRSGEISAQPIALPKLELYKADQGAGTGISYVQLGFKDKDGGEWWPPKPE